MLNVHENDSYDTEIQFYFRDGNHQQEVWQSYAHLHGRKRGGVRGSHAAISKIGNGESRNGERGTGNGERGISKIGNI